MSKETSTHHDFHIRMVRIPVNRAFASTSDSGQLSPSSIENSASQQEQQSCIRIKAHGEDVRYDDWPPFFTISHIDDKDKFTEYAHGCLAVMVIGKSPTGETFSLMAHAAPLSFRKSEQFRDTYRSALRQFSQQTENGTQFGIIAGGSSSSFTLSLPDNRFSSQRYQNILQFIARTNKRELNCPTYVVPPKQYGTPNFSTHTYLATAERTLYVAQSDRQAPDESSSVTIDARRVRPYKRFWRTG